MYEILQNHIYSDKVGAVIRELCANAYDAHVRANCINKSFDVVIPSHSNPNFTVRDYGNGLDEDSIRNIYGSYGESDKALSNDEIGCFGLGAKSFFCLTDNCTVIACFEGYKYTYSIFTDNDKVPTISLMNKVATKEPSGLEVRVPVSKYIQEFVQKFPHYLRHYKIPPNVIGSNVKLGRQETLLMTGSNFKLYANKSYGKECNIVMGNIPYQVESNFGNSYRGTYTIDIDVPLGSLDIVASREKLAYNTKTTKNLQAILKQVETEIVKYIDNNVQNKPTYWEACAWFNGNAQLCDFHSNICYNTQKVSGGIHLGHKDFTVHRNGKKGSEYQLFPRLDTKFYHADLERGSLSRIKTGDTYYLVKGKLDAFSTVTEYPANKVTLCSSLPKLAKVKKEYIDGIQQYQRGRITNLSKVELKTPQYYVRMVYNDVLFNDKKIDLYKFNSILVKLASCNILDNNTYTIYVVRNNKADIVQKHKWMDFTTVMQDKFQNFIEKNKIEEKLVNYQEYQALTRLNWFDSFMKIKYKGLEDFQEKSEELKKDYESFVTQLKTSYGYVKDLMTYLSKETKVKPKYDLQEDYNQLLAKYSILSIVQQYNNNYSIIISYMKLVDGR
jgi:hypothetical protein